MNNEAFFENTKMEQYRKQKLACELRIVRFVCLFAQCLRVFLRVLNDAKSETASQFVTVDRQRKCIAVHESEYESSAQQRRAPPKLFGFDEVFTQHDSMVRFILLTINNLFEN